MRSGPAPGEVRNPWGRAGKPETRAARLKEQEESLFELRVKAWRMQKDRNGDWDADNVAYTDYLSAYGDGEHSLVTTDIEEFHDRAISLLRESGGRMNSLTFGYKWEQQYGESLAAFARMQRLSVAEMLRQSNRFWVVDMQGTDYPKGGDDVGSTVPMQIFVLVDKVGNQPSKGQRLGDKLSMHGESEAIRQWKQRRTKTITRGAGGVNEFDIAAEVVGMPSEPSAAVGTYVVGEPDEAGEKGAEQVACIHLPKKVRTEKRLTALLDALEPSISGIDSRLGLRQMHVAWSSNCTCASSAVTALRQLSILQTQAKGRQVKRLEEQIRSYADVVQSGVSSLRGAQLADALAAVKGRSGFENLIKFAASRLLHSDLRIVQEAQDMQPSHVARLVEAFSGGQRDPTLYRKLAGICMQMPPSAFTVDDIAHILEGFDVAGVRDKGLLRHMAAILQSLPSKTYTARGIGSLASSLATGGALDDAAFRSLSFAAQQLTPEEYSADTLSVIMVAFASAEMRDPKLFRHIATVIDSLEMGALDAEIIARISRSASKLGIRDEAVYGKLGEAVLSLKCSAYSPDTVGRIAGAFSESTVHKDRVFKYLALVIKKMDAWTFEMEHIASLVEAYSRAHMLDTALFARLSTILQQMDPVMFSLSSIATVANAYTNPKVLDKALLGRLASVLQQMDAKVVTGPEAVQDVSVILNAYAQADMRETALALSHTLTNHLRPHVGGLTAQAMATIVMRVGVA